MKNGLVVKDNALMNASYNLEVTEQRLMLLAIVYARETGEGITSESKLEICASDYSKQFNVTKEASYKALKSAVNNLFERQFSFQEETKKGIGTVRSRWVSRIKYIDDSAIIEITFAPDVVPLITRLEKQFTSYQLKQVSQLTGKYAIRLYEVLIAWREIGKVPQIELSEFRRKLGIENHEYKAMNHFKSRVLESSIKQINEHTDITVSYDQHKRGRTITGFSFEFKSKSSSKKSQAKDLKRDQNTVDMFYQMTDAQIQTYASKLSKLPEFGYLATGNEGYDALASKISIMLKNSDQNIVFKTALKKLGFKESLKK